LALRRNIEFRLDGFITAVFGILPGFVSTISRQVLAPAESSLTGEWVARDIMESVFLNIIVSALLVLSLHLDLLNHKIEYTATVLNDLPGWYAPAYLAIVYLFAFLYGIFGARLLSRRTLR
jgi:hypothetical protein